MTRFITISEDPPNREVPLSSLAVGTSSPFYVRSIFPIPQLDADIWSLTVGGAVDRPVSLSLAELRSLPFTEQVVTLECAGNGRSLMDPVPEGVPWGLGAVSTARFGGTRLEAVLEQVEPSAAAEDYVFTGADRGNVHPDGDIIYAFRLAASQTDRALLVWEMNGNPLPAEHGYPVRLLVPGHYGMQSVKWLTSITALESRFEGHFPRKYRYFGDPTAEEGEPVGPIRVRSVITEPASGAELPLGPVTVRGLAWSGQGSIASVEVGTGPQSRHAARMGEPEGPYAALSWEWTFDPPSRGVFRLSAKASDAAGHVQPEDPIWNRHGYGNNFVHEIEITIV
ncbi:MAG: sulfite oxidase [Acidimicrobiia bacterium]